MINSKTQHAIVLSTFLLTFLGSVHTTAAHEAQWYVGADSVGIGISYKNGYGSVLPESLGGVDTHFGYRFNDHYGIETSYVVARGTGAFVDLTVQGATLDAMGYLPLWHGPTSLFTTVGVSVLNANVSIPILGLSSNQSEFGFRFGGGVEYSFNDNLSIRGLIRYQTANFSGTANLAATAEIGLNWYP